MQVRTVFRINKQWQMDWMIGHERRKRERLENRTEDAWERGMSLSLWMKEQTGSLYCRGMPLGTIQYRSETIFNRMTLPVDVSQTLSLATPLL